ncbi:hypothetical protein D3C87_2058510 [compost metagenome]
MPGFSFMYQVVTATDLPKEGAIRIPGKSDQWIVPKEEAENLISYLMSLKRDRDPVKASEAKK